jgi:hypothetical protein
METTILKNINGKCINILEYCNVVIATQTELQEASHKLAIKRTKDKDTLQSLKSGLLSKSFYTNFAQKLGIIRLVEADGHKYKFIGQSRQIYAENQFLLYSKLGDLLTLVDFINENQSNMVWEVIDLDIATT